MVEIQKKSLLIKSSLFKDPIIYSLYTMIITVTNNIKARKTETTNATKYCFIKFLLMVT